MNAAWIVYALFLLPLALLLAGAAGASERASRPPNIVLILADDLGYGDPQCYNPASRIPTPNLDRLAARGIRFTDAHTPSAVCTPTRYGLLTGRYAWRSRLKKGVLWGDSPALIEPGRPTIASVLKERGYRTGGSGKWHLGLGDAPKTDYAQPLRPGPVTVGFDYFFGIPASLDMEPYLYFENDRAVEQPTGHIEASAMRRHGGGGYWRAGAIAPGFRHQDVLPTITDRALEFVRQQTAEQPFFLYFPLTSPHTPWMPAPEFRGKSGADWYGDFVTHTDAMVGRVLQALDERGLADDTLVIFTSDNGAHWLPEDIRQHGHRANADWRGQKSDIWDGGHRVPFIARWPGKIAPAARCDRMVCLTDLFTTLAAAAGAAVPADAAEDSFNFLPLFLGGDAPVRESVVHHSGDGLFGLRMGDWKLVEGLGSGGFTPPKTEAPVPGGPAGQLYDLKADPAEQENLWLRRPEVVSRLKAELDRIRDSGRSRP